MTETKNLLKDLKEIFVTILFMIAMAIIIYTTIVSFVFSTAYLAKKYKELFKNQQNIEMIDNHIEKGGK